MANRNHAVLCVGHATVDTIYGVPSIPACPTKVLATRFTQVSGGMAANAAAAIARLGGDACFCGRIGDDPGGAFFLEEMTQAGVDVSPVRTLPGCQTPISAILVDDSGERLVCTHNDPAMDSDPACLDRLDMAGFGAVCVDVRWPEASQRCLRNAERAGLPGVLDLDIADDTVIAPLLPLASHPIFSRPALLAYTGCAQAGDVQTGDPQIGDAQIRDSLRLVARQTRGYVGVTLGEDGYLWLEDGELASLPAPEVHVVDTLAAGDVFHGAFALALAEGRDNRAAAAFATAAASLKCARSGGRHAMPTRSEVDAVINDEAAGASAG